MLRPLLLLVPCLLALGWDMDDLHARGHLDRDIPGFDQEFEDMEDELEDDFEEDRSLNDDFDEHADDMEDLEDLTPEEVEDREAILDDREGRLAGPIVRCGRWTNRVVELDGNTTAKFESTKITNRCTVLYKPTNCTGPIKLTCSKFLVDNRQVFVDVFIYDVFVESLIYALLKSPVDPRKAMLIFSIFFFI
jgi:hypothetical protein